MTGTEAMTAYMAQRLTRDQAEALITPLQALGFTRCHSWRNDEGGYYVGCIHPVNPDQTYVGIYSVEQARRYAAGDLDVAV